MLLGLTVILLLPLFTKAENCPTPSDLQTGKYANWILLDINDASSLSDERIDYFQTHVKSFALAEWEESAPEGAAHCYYYGSDEDFTYLGAYLAKSDLKAAAKEAWKTINEDVMQCRSDLRSCLFERT